MLGTDTGCVIKTVRKDAAGERHLSSLIFLNTSQTPGQQQDCIFLRESLHVFPSKHQGIAPCLSTAVWGRSCSACPRRTGEKKSDHSSRTPNSRPALCAQAKHPNIAVYLDVLEGATNFYVIMEAHACLYTLELGVGSP